MLLKPPCDEHLGRSTAHAGARPESATWILLATILASSLVFIDGTAVNMALPIMQRDLHAGASQAQWIIEGYALVLGAFLLMGGALGDRYGRKRIFIAGVIIFALASIACGFASSMTLAIAARAFQAIGGTLLAPTSLALIGAHFSGDARGKAIGTWSSFTAATSIISPILGGTLVERFGWRSVFFINVPLAYIVLFAAFRHMNESQAERAGGKLDVVGSIMAAFGLGAIVYSLISLSAGDHTAAPVVLFAAAIVALIAFVATERKTRDPIVPLDLFHSATFTGVNLLTLLLYASLGGLLYFLPFELIQGHGYSPAAAGAALLPFGLLLSLLSRTFGGLAVRFGPHSLLTIGPLFVAAGFASLGLFPNSGSYWTRFFPAIVLVGFGMSIVVAPLTSTVMNAVESERMGVAAGINSAVARVAGLLAIAVTGVVLWMAFNARLDRNLETLHASPAERQTVDSQRSKLSAARLPDDRMRAAVLSAYDHGFVDVALVCAALAAAASVAALILISPRPRVATPKTVPVHGGD